MAHTVSGLGAGALDDLILSNCLGLDDWPTLQHAVFDASFEADYKEDLLSGEFCRPSKIHEGFVHICLNSLFRKNSLSRLANSILCHEYYRDRFTA